MSKKVEDAADLVMVVANHEAASNKMTQTEAVEFYRLICMQADEWANQIQSEIK